MAYDREHVARLLAQGADVRALARMVGQAEGGSIESQHTAALQFWQLALTLPEDEVSFDRAFAEAEIARHTAAIQPTPSGLRVPQRRGGEPV